MSTKGSTGNIDAKREEFRKYLEKEGVLEYLTKQLVRLYEEADKPSNALDYLKNNFNGKEAEVAQLKAENLEKENQELKERIKSLESEKTDLELVIKELQKTTSNGILSSAIKSPKDNTEEKAEMEEDEPMETVEDQSNTQASDDKVGPTSNEDVVEGTEGDTEDAKKLTSDNTDGSSDTKQNEGTTDNVDAPGAETKSKAEAEESAAM